MNTDSTIFVAGARGMVGSALVRALRAAGFNRILTPPRDDLDLERQSQVDSFFQRNHIDNVFLAAAKVGGIHANSTQPAEFIRENLLIQTNVIHSAYQHGVKKLIFLGSSCIYPNTSWSAITEEMLLSGGLESTNRAYAVAKIAGIEMCRSYTKQYGFDCVSVMPTNLYGPKDNYDEQASHVLPALIRRFYTAVATGAPTVTCWGTGQPLREFLHVDDLASACLTLMCQKTQFDLVNVGSSSDISIKTLAELVASIAGFKGQILWDKSKPDGTRRKLIDSRKMHSFGWQPTISLEDGIRAVYAEYADYAANYRRSLR